MTNHTKLAVVIVVGAAWVFSLATAAVAETYGDGSGVVGIGTNGSGSDWQGGDPMIAVTHGGGCAEGTVVAVAVGPGCGARSDYVDDLLLSVTIGLLGAPSDGREVSVSDTGPAGSCTSGCWPVGVAASLGGDVDAPYNIFAVGASGTGSVTSERFAVSGTGDASGQDVVSITGDATGESIGVSGTENATGSFLAVAPDGDASSSSGVAVSVTGDADGGLVGVSVLGDSGLAP